MRLIHEIVRTVLRMFFDLNEEKEEIQFTEPKLSENYNSYIRMAGEGQINEAENLLYEELDEDNPECMKQALLFYDYINEFTDEQLEQANYSREEICEGIQSVLRIYGYTGMVESLGL